MDGVHDLGGVQGLGAVEREGNEPVFHSDWERRVFGMMLATLGQGSYNLDEFRHAIERMNPVDYLSSRYYEHWLHSMQANLIAHGVISAEEVAEKAAQLQRDPGAAVPARTDAELAGTLLGLVHQGASTAMETDTGPRFAVGDKVRARNIHPSGHTRLPRYVRGKAGTVDHVHPSFVLPDTNAHLRGEHPQHVYSVRFPASELWGEDAEPGEEIYVDLWESYLEPI